MTGTDPLREPAAPETARSDEERMLHEALGDEAGATRVISREPYGAGALTGIEEVGEAGTRYWYVDTSGRPVLEETGFVLGADDGEPAARIWLHPADPRLPALAPATFPDAAEQLMGRMGVAVDRAPELLVYRPGKRAMLRMRAGERETYLKIVRPDRATGIVAMHEALRAADVPVPHVTGWSELGIVLTEAAEGVPLTSRLADLDADATLASIDALRSRVAGVDLGREGRASLALRHDWYRERLRAALARVEARGDVDAAAVLEPVAALEALVDGVPAASLEVPEAERATVHGDLHVGQLFVAPEGPGTVTGVIDIDTAGSGDPVDDEAALLGHLVASIALARAVPERAAGFERMLAAASARWLGGAGARRERLVHRVAVHVLAHALGPLERGDVATAAAQLERGVRLLGPTR